MKNVLKRNLSIISSARERLNLACIDAMSADEIANALDQIAGLFQSYIDFENGYDPDKD